VDPFLSYDNPPSVCFGLNSPFWLLFSLLYLEELEKCDYPFCMKNKVGASVQKLFLVLVSLWIAMVG
jgi:hypothetical protein